MDKIKETKHSLLKRFLFGALATISIVLTAQYFIQYVSFPLMDQVHPILATVAVLALGLLAADVGAILWKGVLHNNCRSSLQVWIAYIMIGVTLTMATVTTMFGIADAFNGAELVPASWHEWVGWMIVVVIAIEFLGGAFLFSFFEPEQTIAREIMSAVVDDADAVVKAVRTKMADGRDQRVAQLSDQISTQADTLIYSTRSTNDREARQLVSGGAGSTGQTLATASAAAVDDDHDLFDDVIDGEAHTWVGEAPAPMISEGVDEVFPEPAEEIGVSRPRDIGFQSQRSAQRAGANRRGRR